MKNENIPQIPEHLWKEAQAIECTRCGNCCPNTCELFTRSNDLATCTGHPLAHGGVNIRGVRNGCDLSPVTLHQIGFYCPPVLELLRDKVPEIAKRDWYVTTPFSDGQMFYKDVYKNPCLEAIPFQKV
jgi:hypothetical protein